MADKTIGDLTQAESIGSEDLFVLEQNGEAKKLKGARLVKYAQDTVSAQVTAATEAAESAETAKTGAESAQTQAHASQTAAARSASAAANSAASASASASDASKSADAAAASETAAKNSEKDAKESENAAKASYEMLNRKLWFGTIEEYNALETIEPDICYHILEGDVPV